jgi:uncharacterized membrane protein YfcA
MFGVGGGFLLTPMLVFLGIPAAVAVATGAAQIAAASATGLLNAWRRRAIDWQMALILIVGGAFGTFAGVLFFNAMRRAGYFELILVISYVVLLGLVGGLMLIESARAMLFQRKRAQRPRRRAGAHAWYLKLPLRVRLERSRRAMSVIPILALGLAIGFVGAVLGIGGGFLVVPALIYLFGIPAALVVGTSLAQILITMIAATVIHAVTNQSVDIVLALILIVGSVTGAQFGVRAGQTLKGEHFRLMLALLIFGVAVRFALDIVLPPVDPFSLGPMDTRP